MTTSEGRPLRAAIGSVNPAKIDAVRRILESEWPGIKLLPVDVPSGVSAMPFSDEECLRGARNRAIRARQLTSADLGIGLEGGVSHEAVGLVLHGWAVVVDAEGREGIGGTARLPLPPLIATRLLAGEELGQVMDDLLGEKDVRQRGGAVGALTNGLVMRGDAFSMAVAYALAPFVATQFYPQEKRAGDQPSPALDQ